MFGFGPVSPEVYLNAWSDFWDFVKDYQTLISSILLIAAGFYGYKKQRKLKEDELDDAALSKAVTLQFKIEQMFKVFKANANAYKDAVETGKRNHIEAIEGFYWPVLANPYLEKQQFAIDWEDLGELKFLGVEMEKIGAFYSSYSTYTGYSEHLRDIWADLDPKIITKEIYEKSMRTYAGFFISVITDGIHLLEILSEKTKVKPETTKEEKISILKPFLQEDLDRMKKKSKKKKS